MTAARQLSDEERIDWLRLSRTENIGPVTFHSLIARYGGASAALDALPELARRGGRSRSFNVFPRTKAEDDIAQALEFKAQFVAAGERGYPPYLRHVHAAPPMLCVAGNLDLANMDAVAVVGARNASAGGRKLARMIARTLAEAGILVVSGLARGIDTAAHEAAIDHATAAVMAGGIDHFYPPENAALQRAIAERGLLITEMPPGTAPKAEYFPRRNRIISGMARAVIVVEAALRSGSLITARFAAEQGRDVFAVPGSPLDPRSEGTNKLIKDGAAILTSVDDVLESLRMTVPPRDPVFLESDAAMPARTELSDGERDHLLSLMSPVETSIDDLVRESGLHPEQASAVLLELEIAGRVQRVAGGRFVLMSG